MVSLAHGNTHVVRAIMKCESYWYEVSVILLTSRRRTRSSSCPNLQQGLSVMLVPVIRYVQSLLVPHAFFGLWLEYAGIFQ